MNVLDCDVIVRPFAWDKFNIQIQDANIASFHPSTASHAKI